MKIIINDRFVFIIFRDFSKFNVELSKVSFLRSMRLFTGLTQADLAQKIVNHKAMFQSMKAALDI